LGSVQRRNRPEKTSSAALVPVSLVSRSLEPAGARLLSAFFAGRNPRTLTAYRQDLADFRAFMGAETSEDAGRLLLERGHGEANGLALAYRAHLLERGLSPATVNRRLAALRSLVKLARTLGFVSWALDVESVKSETYRDTRGPGRAGVRLLFEELERRTDAKGLRDRALVRLLYDLGLRRGEVASLRLEDVDLRAGSVAVLGKGRTERAALTLPEPTQAALVAWLAVRGSKRGPVFLNFDHAGKGEGLAGRSIARLVAKLGNAVGLTVRPHGLRHAAITEALDLTGGDVRKVQRFSRHRDLRVLNRYDDNREDLGGSVARLVAATA
jgi:integrase/recombinase XerC